MDSVLTRRGAAAEVGIYLMGTSLNIFSSLSLQALQSLPGPDEIRLLQETSLTVPATLISPYLSSFCPSSVQINTVTNSALVISELLKQCLLEGRSSFQPLPSPQPESRYRVEAPSASLQADISVAGDV